MFLTYRFHLAEQQKEEFRLELDPLTLQLNRENDEDLPEWSRLDYRQCPHCPLCAQQYPHCPLMASISGIVIHFSNIISYDEIFLEVETQERTISQNTTAQRALGSFMGLVMATSGCPYTAYFRPMARFHLPLASEEETIYRATSMYLLAQYFIRNKGGTTDFSLAGLDTIYKDMQQVNTSIINRLRGASKGDSSVNAIIMLDMFARVMPYVIEDSIEDVEYLFTAYLNKDGTG